MRNILFILTVFYISTEFADNKVARIKDVDGFTYIRTGQGKDFSIVGTVDTTEFIYCEPTTKSDWVKVMTLSWGEKKQVEGYIHKSRIHLIENIDTNEQKRLLTKILNTQKDLADKFRIAFENKNHKAYRKAVNELESYDELKYTPILSILPKYFCATGDSAIIKMFFATMWADRGSANETPSFEIGKCFICNPDLIIRELTKLKTKKEKNSIIDSIEWGLLNHYGADENGKSLNKELTSLKSKLEKQKSWP